jgi:hypothetical protein
MRRTRTCIFDLPKFSGGYTQDHVENGREPRSGIEGLGRKGKTDRERKGEQVRGKERREVKQVTHPHRQILDPPLLLCAPVSIKSPMVVILDPAWRAQLIIVPKRLDFRSSKNLHSRTAILFLSTFLAVFYRSARPSKILGRYCSLSWAIFTGTCRVK